MIDYLNLTDILTRRLKRRMPWIDTDELYSVALLAITRAHEKFDTRRKASYKTFCLTKGYFLALDELRSSHEIIRTLNPTRDDIGRAKTFSIAEISSFYGDTLHHSNKEFRLDLEAPPCRNEMIERENLLRWLKGLSKKEIELICWVYIDEMTHSEIGQILKINTSSVDTRINVIKKKLHELRLTLFQREKVG